MKEQYKQRNINIMGRDYPVKCTSEEEHLLIHIERDLKQQLNQYRLKYEQLDIQDCLSMALIENQLAARQSAQNTSEQPYFDRIDKLTHKLMQHLP